MNIFQRIDRKISKIRTEIDNKNILKEEWKKKKGKTIFLLQTPTHINVGDQFIAEAEVRFLKKHFNNISLVEIKEELIPLFLELYRTQITKEDIILLHGGGNMGDEYLRHEQMRRKVIQEFPDNKILIFPQTIFFRNTDNGQKQLKISSDIYNAHSDLTVVAREQISLDTMKKNFSCKILFVPDIVMSMEISASQKTRKGALMLFRNDTEKVVTNSTIEELVEAAKQRFGNVVISDMIYSEEPNVVVMKDQIREKIVQHKINQYQTAEIVFTDRLHGMIVAAITKTPCIVMSNYNHKVRESLKWIAQYTAVELIENTDEIEEKIESVLQKKDFKFPYEFLDGDFEILKTQISEMISH